MNELDPIVNRVASIFGLERRELFDLPPGAVFMNASRARRARQAVRHDRVFEARAAIVRMARRELGLNDLEIAEAMGMGRTFVADVQSYPRRRKPAAEPPRQSEEAA